MHRQMISPSRDGRMDRPRVFAIQMLDELLSPRLANLFGTKVRHVELVESSRFPSDS